MSVELFTIGHSNQSLVQFLDLLSRHTILVVVDVRRFPASRSFPHFNREDLSKALAKQGIEYYWLAALGGRRPKQQETASKNLGLHNESFRNYADFLSSQEFRNGFDLLMQIAGSKRTAIMCSESVYWRCHRRLISDVVQANGGTVLHIFSSGELRPHQWTDGAKAADGIVTYPG